MKINEIMSKDVKFINKEKTVEEAAKMMKSDDFGSIPVEENDKLIGMITDRDLTLSILANGRDKGTKVGECLTDKIKYCYEDENAQDVANQMSDLKIRRMPVMSRDKELVGIVSLGALATDKDSQQAALKAFSHIAM